MKGEFPSVYVDRPETPFTDESPELLRQRGFEFVMNIAADSSLESPPKIVNLSARRAERDLTKKGLLQEDDRRTVIKDLRTFVTAALETGHETRLIRGHYDPVTETLRSNADWVAAFQRFALDRFITDQTVPDLNHAGYTFDQNFSLHAWGDHLEQVHPSLVDSIRMENEELERYVAERERAGYRVQLVRGSWEADALDPGAQSVAAFIQRKEQP